MAGTMVAPSAPNLMSDPSGVAEAAAAQAAGMQAAQARQDHLMANARDGHAGDLKPAESTLQPFLPPEPGDGKGGVT